MTPIVRFLIALRDRVTSRDRTELKHDRRWFIVAIAITAVALSWVPIDTISAVAAGESAVGTWATAPVSAAPTEANRINNQTLREIVHISIGGDQVRVKFSNRYGTAPLVVQAAHVALRAGDERIVPGSGGQLTFSGQTSFSIPAFGELYSDWLPFRVPHLVLLCHKS
jgi:hypothetical protein